MLRRTLNGGGGMVADDRALGMDRPIARRDFLNGVAVTAGASLAGSLLPGAMMPAFAEDAAPQDRPGYYPPTLTGMRGSHPGSFEDAHKLRDGDFKLPRATPPARKPMI